MAEKVSWLCPSSSCFECETESVTYLNPSMLDSNGIWNLNSNAQVENITIAPLVWICTRVPLFQRNVQISVNLILTEAERTWVVGITLQIFSGENCTRCTLLLQSVLSHSFKNCKGGVNRSFVERTEFGGQTPSKVNPLVKMNLRVGNKDSCGMTVMKKRVHYLQTTAYKI